MSNIQLYTREGLVVPWDELKRCGIFMVPKDVYAKFHINAAAQVPEVAVIYIRQKLMQYIQSAYPGSALSDFAELQLPDGTWGMFVRLLSDGTTQFGSEDIEQTVKQLTGIDDTPM